MKYCDHHGGGSDEVIQTFASPFELGEYLRKRLYPFYVDVNFNNLHADKYTERGDPRRGWDELWIVYIDEYGSAGWADSWWPEGK